MGAWEKECAIYFILSFHPPTHLHLICVASLFYHHFISILSLSPFHLPPVHYQLIPILFLSSLPSHNYLSAIPAPTHLHLICIWSPSHLVSHFYSHPVYFTFTVTFLNFRENGVSTITQMAVKGLPCEYIPLGLKTTLPPHGLVRTPMVLSYHLVNRSQELINLEVSMEGSEAFMFSGYKQVMISIDWLWD